MFNKSLNIIIHLNGFNIKASLAFILLISLTVLCCGKRTPPLPPTERVFQSTIISGFQQGNKVILSWKMPVRNSSENDTTYINQIDVYRIAEKKDSPEQITEEEFSSRSTLIDTIPVNNEDFSLKILNYVDNLEFSTQPARLRYAIKFVNKSGQKATFSNFLTFYPSAKIAEKPENLTSEITQDAVLLKWEKPQTNIDGTTPANILGFNIFRQEEKQTDVKKINSSPISVTTYADNSFDFDKKYIYFVRTVSIGGEGEPVESLNSVKLEITPRDTFPPSSPESITIAASPNSISLFFAANAEKDILGYKVNRTTDKNLPLDKWELLTDDPININTFEDRNVRSGVKYYYFLTAIDKFANTSKPSLIVSETAP